MKKIFLPPRTRKNFMSILGLPALTAIFLLQSCCFFLQPGVAKQSCNCGNDKRAYAANNKSPDNKDAGQAGLLTTQNNAQPSQTLTEEIADPAVIPPAGLAGQSGQSLLYTSLVTTTVAGQKDGQISNQEKKMPLGIKSIRTHIIAGPNISVVNNKEDFGGMDHKKKAGTGFQFGFGSSYSFSENFAICPSLIFKQNNASEVLSYSYTGGGGSTEYKSKYSYSYISVPVVAELRIANGLTATAGPEINYLLKATEKTSGYGENSKMDITKKSTRVGVGAQVGILYAIPGSPLSVQLLYDQRISRLNEKSSSDYSPGGGYSYEEPAMNMQSVQLGVVCAICELLKKK